MDGGKKRPKDIPFICGLAFTVAAFFFNIISFVAPTWLESIPGYNSQFIRLGLWVACFNGYVHPEDYVSKKYYGCWYVYYPEYNYIRDWLNPPWFYAVQMLSLLDFILNIIALIIVGFKACKIMEKNGVKSDRTAIACQLIASCCFIFVAIMMGVMSKDREWMPRHDHNRLAWGFALNVIAGFFTIFATIMLFIRYLRVHYQEDMQQLRLLRPGAEAHKRQQDVEDFETRQPAKPSYRGTMASTTSAASASAKHREAMMQARPGTGQRPGYQQPRGTLASQQTYAGESEFGGSTV